MDLFNSGTGSSLVTGQGQEHLEVKEQVLKVLLVLPLCPFSWSQIHQNPSSPEKALERKKLRIKEQTQPVLRNAGAL